MSLFVAEQKEVEIIDDTWWRYSDKNLDSDILFFTSSEQAADGYRQQYMETREDIFKFKIQGQLKLVNVAVYIQNRGLTFDYNIINENNQRKDSTTDTAERERQFYRDLIAYSKDELKGIDGFFTPASKFHHEEMILVNSNIIESLKDFQPFKPRASVFETPTKNPAVTLQLENRQIILEKRNIKSTKRRRLHF